MHDVGTVTLSLQELADGDQRSLDRLVTLVYDELRRIAEGQLKRGYQDQAHVLAIAARAMRKILINHARPQNGAKRGGGLERFVIDKARDGCAERPSHPTMKSINQRSGFINPFRIKLRMYSTGEHRSIKLVARL